MFVVQTGPIATVIELIHDLPYLHGGTRTDKALAKAASDLYSPQGGDREGVANVLLVVTDGHLFYCFHDRIINDWCFTSNPVNLCLIK